MVTPVNLLIIATLFVDRKWAGFKAALMRCETSLIPWNDRKPEGSLGPGITAFGRIEPVAAGLVGLRPVVTHTDLQ
jgi:hypothetical protein